jgi:glycosyltransferase
VPQDILICEPDEGIFDALNKGLERAEGDMIGWIGSDDIFHTEIKASEIISYLQGVDIVIARTVMVDHDRIKRVFWLPSNPARAVFMGLHNPHFSTFGRSKILRAARFDKASPIADIGYFLEIFKANPTVQVDHRISTLQQVGGFSNGSIRKSLAMNSLTFAVYRTHLSPLRAAMAAVLKVVPKVFSAVFYKANRVNVEDDLLPPKHRFTFADGE